MNTDDNAKAVLMAIQASVDAKEITPEQEAELATYLAEVAAYLRMGFTPNLCAMAALNARLARIEARLNGEGLN